VTCSSKALAAMHQNKRVDSALGNHSNCGHCFPKRHMGMQYSCVMFTYVIENGGTSLCRVSLWRLRTGTTYSVSNDAMGTNSFMGLSVNGKKNSKDR